MPTSKHVLGVACALLLACGSESAPPPKPPDAGAVFPNLPLPPNAEFVSREGGADALQITLFSPTQAASVVDYYRQVLSQGNWRLVSDVKKPDGTVLLYAEQNGPPLWVQVWPTTDGAGTMVQLAGALAGSDSARHEQPASKPASKPAPKPRS